MSLTKITTSIFFAVISTALSLTATAFANPNSCLVADTVKREVQFEIYRANPPVGPEVYTTHAGYQRMKSAINTCQTDAFRSCYRNLRPAISLVELNQLFREWRQNRLYKLVDPSGLCYNRAYLLAQELTERGYSVQLLTISPSPTLMALTRDEHGRVTHQFNYGNHWVVQIVATDARGVSKTMALDPQFALEPMTRDSYFVSLGGQVCKPGPNQNVADCNYQVYGPTHQIYPVYIDGPVLSNKCGWSINTDLTNELERALAIMPKSLPPSPYPYEYVRTFALKHAWTSWENFARNDIRDLETQLLRTGDRSTIQMRLDQRKIDLQNIVERRAAIGF